MAKYLDMVFRNASGTTVTLSVADPKEGLTLTEVQTVMQDIVAKNLFTSRGGDLVQVVDARLRTSDTVSLI